MECPHCHQKIPGIECPACGFEIPSDSRYCMKCGAGIVPEGPVVQAEDEFDPDERVLCPDGSCTGIIVDGRCVVCGRTVTGEESCTN